MNRIVRGSIVTAAAAALTIPLATVPASAAPGDYPVTVSGLSVDGRDDGPLDVGTDRPTFSWMMSSEDVAGNPCYDGSAGGTCALDAQTAYEIEAASSVADLESGDLLWDTGKVDSGRQLNVAYGADEPLGSRDTVAWRVRVWDALGHPSSWSDPATFKVGLLEQDDWGDARWIEQVDRDPADPLPIFARQFDVAEDKEVASAHLYVSGAGLHHATINGEDVTDEHLAPGNTNYQLSTEYRTYDVSSVLEAGENAVGVELGNGTAYVRRSIHNEEVGRTDPYAWWQSQIKGSGELVAPVGAGATTVLLTSTEDYHVGGTINIDTGDGGDRLESRVITDIGTAGEDGTGISFEPGLDAAHAAGAQVTASGNNIAETDPSAGAAVTPRMIARLEVSYADGSSDVVVSDRDWRAASGALVTDAWYAGEDYDARREQVGWNEPGADLTDSAERRDGSAMNWASAGIAPPPNLATELVSRAAEGIYEAEQFTPQNITNPAEGVWVFDFGQNFAGFARLNLPELPEGTVVTVKPAESLAEDGTVDQSSLGPGGRGSDLFNSYITAGLDGGESRTPMFNYFGMQWVQIEGLPEGYTPTADIVTGLRLQADTPEVGTFDSSNARINRINKMARYSMASQIFSTFTDCPGREKQSYPADYTMPMDGFSRMFEFDAYLRTTQRHLVEGQSIADSYMFGNVALKTPVHDWGYTRRFGDEINWGNGIILVPAFLYEYYGDTRVMTETYDRMVYFVEYIQREKAEGHIVDGALADWVSAEQTTGRITGTWGYYVMMTKMAMMAELTGHDEDAVEFAQTAEDIKAAFNDAFLNTELGYYTEDGTGTDGATQAAQALPLDAGMVPDEYRESVLERLVEDVQEFGPDDGPHFSAGTIGLAAVVRQLTDNGHGEVLFDALQTDTEPGYGYFMEPTTANPDGFTTIGERWSRGSSKNHVILAQIVEWFQTGLVGIDRTAGSVGYDELVFKPQPAGDLTWVEGSFETPRGVASSRWDKTDEHFTLTVEVPANTTAEVWVPTDGDQTVLTPKRATFERVDGDFAVYSVGAGEYTFVAPAEGYDDLDGAIQDAGLDGDLTADLRADVETARIESADGDAAATVAALEELAETLRGAQDVPDGVRSDLLRQAGWLAYEVRDYAGISQPRPGVALVAPSSGGPFGALDLQVDADADIGIDRIVANVYQGGTLVESTQSRFDAEQAASHTASVDLPEGTYQLRYNARDAGGRISATGNHTFRIDATAPTVTVKNGNRFTVGRDGTYSLVSFKLHDPGKIDKVVLNGKEKDLSDNRWSDLNFVEPGRFGAVEGENTLVVHDVAGNTRTVGGTVGGAPPRPPGGPPPGGGGRGGGGASGRAPDRRLPVKGTWRRSRASGRTTPKP